MPRTVSNLEILQEYVRGVLDRAGHHAPNVNEVCLTIAGAIIWVTEDELEVMTRNGEMKNVLWLRVKEQRYAVSYNHDNESIDVREGTTQGKVLEQFTNATPTRQVKNFFEGLRTRQEELSQ